MSPAQESDRVRAASARVAPPPKPDKPAMRSALDALYAIDDVIELRALHKGRKRTDAGYFDGDHREALVDEAVRLNVSGAAVYVNLNRIDPQLLGRYCNRVEDYAKETLTDKDAARRCWLLVDFDPVRPANTSATAVQVAAARERAGACYQALNSEGWPRPTSAESGNGMHLVYPLDLPNDGETTALIKGALAGVAARFDTDLVKIDQSVFNAGRIIKLYGTVSSKGDHTLNTPWRLSRLVSGTDRSVTLTAGQLRALHPKGNGADPKAGNAWGRFDLPAFLSRLGIAYDHDMHEGADRYKLEHCPFNPEHGWGEAAVFQQPDGRLGFRCQHNSCADRGWQDVRALVDGPRQAPGGTPYGTHQSTRPGNGSSPGDETGSSSEGHPGPGDAADHYDVPPLGTLTRKLDKLRTSHLAPKCIIEGLLYADLRVVAAPGGAGKTTYLLYEAVHVALGLPLRGHEIVTPGCVLLVTAEDRAEVLDARLYQVMRGLDLAEDEMARACDNIAIWDVSDIPCQLATASFGEVLETTLAADIIERLKANPPVLIAFDPTVGFGAGEQHVNVNEQALIRAGRKISRALVCAVSFVSHTGKGNAREGALDQYAARGGSALSDGARTVCVMRPWTEADTAALPPPANFTLDVGETAFVMSTPKMSYAPLPPLVWVKRRGWSFEHFASQPMDAAADDRVRADQVERFLSERLKEGVRLNLHALESTAATLKMRRKQVRDALGTLLGDGRVVESGLPESDRRGGRQTYLHPSRMEYPWPPAGAATPGGYTSPSTPASTPPNTTETAGYKVATKSGYTSPPPYREKNGGEVATAIFSPFPSAPRQDGGEVGEEGGYTVPGTPLPPADPAFENASNLAAWLAKSGSKPLREIQQFGPRSLRDRASMVAAVELLVAHGWACTEAGAVKLVGDASP